MSEFGHKRIHSPAAFKASSKTTSRSASRGPGSDDQDHDGLLSDINFGNLDEIISLRLNTLLNDDDNNSSSAKDGSKDTVRLKLNSIPEIIKTLQKSRNEVSSNDRELLLNQLYNLIIRKPTLDSEYDDYEYEQDLLNLLKVFQSAKSNELVLADRAITAFIISNIDEAGAVYSEDKLMNILSLLEKKIADTNIPTSSRQYLIYSYTSLALVIYDESSGYGVDEMFEFLLETLLGLAADIGENISLITALVYGLGALLTVLVEHSNLNELIENMVDSTVDLLTDCDYLEVTKPMAMLFGLAYEIYNYDDELGETLDDDFDPLDDALPFTNTYQLTTRLEELIKSSSKKLSKKDKKEGRSLFRDVLTTINFYSDKEARLNKLSSKKLNVEDDYASQDELVLSHIKLSKSRSLAVKSWFAFFRLIQLKWVFSSGIHTQLANNSRLSKIIRDKPTGDYANKFKSNNEEDEEPEYWTDSRQNKLTHKKKDLAIDHRRMEKLHISLDQTGVLGDDDGA